MLFFKTFYSLKNPEKNLFHSLHKNMKQRDCLITTLIIFRNVSWAVNQNIRMISEASCDTKDWSIDAENTALHHRNKLHFTFR